MVVCDTNEQAYRNLKHMDPHKTIRAYKFKIGALCHPHC